MSRYTITVTRTTSRHTDTDAIIGYDRPLQTFFLQAFPDAEGEIREFETLARLRTAAVQAVSTSYRWHPASCTNCWTVMPARHNSPEPTQSFRTC